MRIIDNNFIFLILVNTFFIFTWMFLRGVVYWETSLILIFKINLAYFEILAG